MNNTKTLAIAAIFIATTLVVGIGTFTTTTTTQSAYAYQKKKGVGGDNGKGNGNGNTVTIEECKNKGSASGFDTAVDQECENLICTHPGNNATCVEEGAVAVTQTQTPTPTTIEVSGQGQGQNFCPAASASLPASITFSVQQSGSAAAQGQFEVTAQLGEPLPKTGTLDSVQITGNSFTITGTELSQPGPVRCGDFTQLPTSATISGQCGTGVTIQFATATGEHATFTGNVECTTT
jgi:hypothetical protein